MIKSSEPSSGYTDTVTSQVPCILGNIYSSVCSSGADDLDATGLSLCLSSMSANSYAYRGLDKTAPGSGAAAIFNNPRGEGRPGVALEQITGFNNCPAGQVHRLGHVRAKSATEPADGRPRHVPWRGDPERCEGAH